MRTSFFDIEAVHLGGVGLGAKVERAVAARVAHNAAAAAGHLCNLLGAAQRVDELVQEVGRQLQGGYPLQQLRLQLCSFRHHRLLLQLLRLGSLYAALSCKMQIICPRAIPLQSSMSCTVPSTEEGTITVLLHPSYCQETV